LQSKIAWTETKTENNVKVKYHWSETTHSTIDQQHVLTSSSHACRGELGGELLLEGHTPVHRGVMLQLLLLAYAVAEAATA